MRHRGGSSSVGLKISKFIISEFLNSYYKSKWRVGNQINICTLCGKCQTACPVNAITVSIHDKTWTLNNRRCRQCLKCIVKCPMHCLSQVKL